MNHTRRSFVKMAGGVLAATVGVSAAGAEVKRSAIGDGPVSAVNELPDGVLITLPNSTMKIEIYTPGVIRVLVCPGTAAPQHESLAVIARPQTHGWHLHETGHDVKISTEAITVYVEKSSGSVRFADATGQFITEEVAKHGRELTPWTFKDVPTYHVRQAFKLQTDEAIYGLGQHQQDVMNYRGKSVHLEQQNMHVAIPVLVSNRGYGIFWDNPAITNVDVGQKTADELSWDSQAGSCLDYYFMYGPEIDAVIAGYRTITGAAPMPGKWVWGFGLVDKYFRSFVYDC